MYHSSIFSSVHLFPPYLISGEVTVNTSGYNYIYTLYNVKEITNITFEVKGPRDAFIGLFPDIKSSFNGEKFYELVIGGWSNKKCAFRKVGYSGRVYRLTRANQDSYLSAGAFRPYWISWQNNFIRLGSGATVGKNVILSYPDRTKPMKINHLAFGAVGVVSNQFKYYNGLLLLRYIPS